MPARSLSYSDREVNLLTPGQQAWNQEL